MKGLSHIEKAAVSKQNYEKQLLKARMKRVMGVLQSNKEALFNTEADMVEKGLLEPIVVQTPQKPLLMIQDGTPADPREEPIDDEPEADEAEWDDALWEEGDGEVTLRAGAWNEGVDASAGSCDASEDHVGTGL